MNVRQAIVATWVSMGMCATAVICIASGVAGTEPDSAVPKSAARSTFDLEVAEPPTPVVVMDTTYLVYELHLTNFARAPVVVTRVQVVVADGGGNELGGFSGDALERRLKALDSFARGDRCPTQP